MLPVYIFAYWISNALIDAFRKGKPLSYYAETRNGFTTGNNDLFLREWYEVDIQNIGFDVTDYINALYVGKKWFPYNKGGSYRKWYGNQEYIINWEGDGQDIKRYGHLVPRSMKYMFYESITWSKISSGFISFRYMPKGFMFDVAGLSLFWNDYVSREYLLSFLNSNVAGYVLTILSPTMNIEVGQISNLPIIENYDKDIVSRNENDNIKMSKQDWDSFETSWNFKKHPLI